jgi:hypothetical protein
VTALAPALPLFILLVVLFFGMTTVLQAGIGGAASTFGSGAYARYVTALDFGAAAGPLLAWGMIAQFDDPFIPLAAGGIIAALTLLVVSRELPGLRAT